MEIPKDAADRFIGTEDDVVVTPPPSQTAGGTMTDTDRLVAAVPPPPPEPPADEESDMPWDKVQDHPDCETSEPWGVVNTETDELMGCHATEEDADAQIAALNAEAGDDDAEETASLDPVPLRKYADATGPPLTDMPADGPAWHSILAPEGVLSGDNRQFAEGSLEWRDLPLPLMYQDATALGHDGAVRVGRIDTIERDGQMVRAAGVWDTSDIAQEAQRQVDVRMLRGVSVDADQVVTELVDGNGDPISIEDLFFGFAEGEEVEAIIENATHARICGATLCSIPAFHQAYLANGAYVPGEVEPGQDEVGAEPIPEGIAASAWSLLAAGEVDITAFMNPGLKQPTPTTVEGDRVFGHLAVWGTCHIGIQGQCVTPPRSSSGYGYYATGQKGGVPVGPLTMGTGHADPTIGWRPAASHYDDTGTVVADIAIGEDDIGIWYAGLIRPGVSATDRADLAASGAVSGDWRKIPPGMQGSMELIAALVVNVPGFPIPRLTSAMEAGEQVSLVASAMVVPEPGRDTADAVYRRVVDRLERRERVQKAAARVRRFRAARAARRIGGQ